MWAVKEVMFTDMAILPITERLLYRTAKFYNYAISNPTHYAHLALTDSISLSKKSKHSWYGSFAGSMTRYGVDIPPELGPLDLQALKSKLEASVLSRIQIKPSTMSRLDIHQLAPITWSRKTYTMLEFSSAAAIASLRSSTHFFNIEHLRRVTRRVDRDARTCPIPECLGEVEDERHALI